MAEKYVLIGVGGSGAKIVEAFTYLCAAGFMESGSKDKQDKNIPEILVRIADMDNTGGNLTRTRETIKTYNAGFYPFFRESDGKKYPTKENHPITLRANARIYTPYF